MKPEFRPGKNIAMKVPARAYERTVGFYRDVLGLEVCEAHDASATESTVFRFGALNLWIDRVPNLSQSEIWLEVTTADVGAAADYLAGQDCERCDEVEPLPDAVNGFWIANPANVIHLVSE